MEKPPAKDDSLTTVELSKMLGLAIGTIQAMFNSGELKGWKTPGGHRRISKASVQEWLATRSTTMPGQTPQVAPQNIGLVKSGLKVLIIEDSVRYQTVLRDLTGFFCARLNVVFFNLEEGVYRWQTRSMARSRRS